VKDNITKSIETPFGKATVRISTPGVEIKEDDHFILRDDAMTAMAENFTKFADVMRPTKEDPNATE
jgi:hypothetical protein